MWLEQANTRGRELHLCLVKVEESPTLGSFSAAFAGALAGSLTGNGASLPPSRILLGCRPADGSLTHSETKPVSVAYYFCKSV